MREREAEAATTRTGRMGAEDPVGIPGRTSLFQIQVEGLVQDPHALLHLVASHEARDADL